MNKLWQLPHPINPLKSTIARTLTAGEPNMPEFVAVFLSLFLLIISLSSLAVSTDTAIQTYILIPVLFIISFLISKKVRNSATLVLLLVTSLILHLLSLYLLLPVGWHADQRAYFVNLIKTAGRIEALEKYSFEGLYYTRYPVPWLTASFISIVSAIDSRTSWLIKGLGVYLCFILFSMLVCFRLLKANSLKSTAWLAIIMITTIYSHRPFQDLIASSVGMLSLVMTFYLYMLRKRFTPILLSLAIPLFISHGLSIYFTTLYLLLLAISSIITSKPKEEVQRAVDFAIIIFVGTWLYQTGVGLIDLISREIPIRWGQILGALASPWFERPTTQSVIEQELRFVRWMDYIISFSAYSLPAIISMMGTLYFLYGFISTRNRSNTTLMLFSVACSLMFLVSGIFAWKGIENAISRYLYVYASPVSILINTSLLHFITMHRSSRRKIVISTMFLIIGVLVLTESFYTPYASILYLPDKEKFEQLYRSYYGPSMFNLNLANIYASEIALRALQKEVFACSLEACEEYCIIYTNGLVTLAHKTYARSMR
uniref:Uncharacterized protein n=1 Tax=Ignisphaera aggregans TaxID=334771 RepID=A0A7C4NNE3_9CREN